jgi:acyl-CoA synthetase (AMP-forming)/AMP-acid ligase II/acyl carrier protein
VESVPLTKPAIGRGIDGVQLLVMARDGILAGVGEPGEIVIRTPYLSQGYRNDSDLSARRFAANPFTPHLSDRVYKTGDVGRYRADGTVELIGRRDLQVKVRGVRVEIQEVEQMLLQHPGVADAAVVSHSLANGDLQLVAFFVAATGTALPTSAALRTFLGRALVEPAIPARFECIARMPMTTNSKLDRAALAAAAVAELPALPYIAPRTDTERSLSLIWNEVLGCDRIGMDETFFDRGGHSLLAMQVMSRIRGQYGVDVPLRALFETPTIAGLAAEIDRLAPAQIEREEFEF